MFYGLKFAPPARNPKFIFSAHSSWCNYAKSSNSLEVKLIRPEITKAEWQDIEVACCKQLL